jgi:hypothetical protein
LNFDKCHGFSRGYLLEQSRELPDLKICWIIPEIVRQERQFQMLQEAFRFLPTIERIERLLGHNLNITRDILEIRVREAIDRQIEQYGIAIQSPDLANVDWKRLIEDASYRRPPFEPGAKEKGFKDAIILETFVQIVAAAPVSPSIARIILVSNDESVRYAASARLSKPNNVHILESVDALRGLINTLGSAVDEEYIEAIKNKAAEMFIKAEDQNSLYYKAKIGASIDQEIQRAGFQLPARADKYSIETLDYSAPRFIKKLRQRIYWSTRFEARLKASKSALLDSVVYHVPLIKSAKEETPLSALDITEHGWLNKSGGPYDLWKLPGDRPLFQTEDLLVAYGTARIDVEWSLAIATSGGLTKPKLETVRFVEVVWE